MKVRALTAVLAAASFIAIPFVGCGSDRTQGFVTNDPDGSTGPSTNFGGPGNDSGPCVGLQCQQVPCSGGGDTTVTGTVFAPNGKLPLYNAIVYVPNAAVEPFASGATCDKCGAVTGSPVATTLSGPDGTFELKNVPVGKNIPLVIQIGKWRRQVTLPEVKQCVANPVTDPELTRLPKKRSEGSIPQIGLTTGECDRLGCMLPKIGIDPSEFGVESDGAAKAVHVFKGATGDSAPSWPDAKSFWSDASKLKNYDMLVLSCECDEHLDNKGAAAFGAMTDYLKAGGRIFTTDFMYTWYRDSSDAALKTAASWTGGAPPAGVPLSFDATFPKGKALVQWLTQVGATPMPGELTPDVAFGNIKTLDANKTQQWATSGAGPFAPPLGAVAGPRVFTVNLPVGLPVEQQCGKGVHIDAHLNDVNSTGGDKVDAQYPNSCNSPLKPGENLLAFFLFDLASCIQNEAAPPAPPVVK